MYVDRLNTQTTSWSVHYMYSIWHRIMKPVLITEKGGEKTCMLSIDGYGCMYMQRHTCAKRQKHVCHLPAGIKLALSCTVLGIANQVNSNMFYSNHYILSSLIQVHYI